MKIKRNYSLFVQFSFLFLFIPSMLSFRESNLVAHYPLNGTLEEINNQYPPIEEINESQYPFGLSYDRFQREKSAYQFLGFLQLLKVPCDTVTGLTDFTISIWANSRSSNKYECLISIANSQNESGNHFALLNSEFWLSFSQEQGEFYRHTFDRYIFSEGQWDQYVITRQVQLGRVSIYKNGQFLDYVQGYEENRSQMKCEGFVLGNDQDSVLGEYEQFQQFIGSVSDLRIYDKGFSQEEVKLQYKYDTTCIVKHCEICSSDFETCVKCIDQLAQNQGFCECPNNYYMNYLTSICEPCATGCKLCKDQSNCLECVDQEIAFLQEGTCMCPQRYYMESEISQCQKCGLHCEICENSDQCLLCIGKQHTTIIDGICSCMSGNYMDQQTSNCRECSFRCYSCLKSAENCVECSDSKNRSLNQNCSCKDGYYEIQDQRECQKCDNKRCATCYSKEECAIKCNQDCETCGIDGLCETCSLGKYLGSKGNCLQCDNSICGTCVDSPKNCIVYCKEGCETCNMYGNCQDCINGFYFHKRQCKKCLENCEQCSNGDECTQCKGDLRKGPLCQCEQGFYEDFNQECQECSYRCDGCSKSSENCVLCIDNLRELPSCGCQSGYYEDQNQNCQKCDQLCFSCEGSAQNCIACTQGANRSKILEEKCQCLPGYYHNDSFATFDCQECESQCSKCENYKFQCTECANKEFRLPFCISKEGFVQADNFSFQNTYKKQIQMEKCLPKCDKCQQSKDICLLCSPGKFRKNNPPVCSCEKGYFDNSGQLKECRKCPLLCKTCLNENTCLSCYEEENRILKRQKAECVCKDGYKEFQGLCICQNKNT